jgi:hypothetical protein
MRGVTYPVHLAPGYDQGADSRHGEISPCPSAYKISPQPPNVRPMLHNVLNENFAPSLTFSLCIVNINDWCTMLIIWKGSFITSYQDVLVDKANPKVLRRSQALFLYTIRTVLGRSRVH